jgi:hypothetical protein
MNSSGTFYVAFTANAGWLGEVGGPGLLPNAP